MIFHVHGSAVKPYLNETDGSEVIRPSIGSERLPSRGRRSRGATPLSSAVLSICTVGEASIFVHLARLLQLRQLQKAHEARQAIRVPRVDSMHPFAGQFIRIRV
jgi:hypothetical protein